ncbi:hypothetical protein [Bdellovibrio reynosensis]|uniref:Uncharacterized protein n=1 Tax=Bdellovibrio reynosensis TaxID=2835041 RepID=A0ABY4C971_9BACT|nr:hypothetical protein [Bdellovibrio reynosensis]UOF01536.1 hypothetical protein MNR06_01030 [Bdellovibrio reynosensis]
MIKKIIAFKDNAVELYEKIKELDQRVFGLNLGDDLYESKRKTPRAPRKNHVKVEDLRPQRADEN